MSSPRPKSFHMSFIKLPFVSAVFLGCASTAVSSHEFWIEPEKFQVEIGENIVADLKNGQEFAGSRLAYFENQFTRFEMIQGDRITPVTGRIGDRPAMVATAAQDGLLIVAHETTPSKVRYKDWAKFVKFAAHKDFPDIAARHDALGFGRENFRESYTRHAKALIKVGSGAGKDRAIGLKTEFVALTNPYAPGFDGTMKVQVLLDGQPRANAQVEVFARLDDQDTDISLHRTNAQGIAAVPVQPGGDYLFDAVVLEPFKGEGPEDVIWQTYWAALTFQVRQ